ncbi:unnamed protein product, partial [Mesorhabditis belari]|uniref:AH domain-containing protein n=1 Tax=Mesorhabditis belari TaxID=2138241 RepID=A0AAF3FEG6_9BILA
MGKKEDELLTASDADLDAQLSLFNSIKTTSDLLLEAAHYYHGFLLDAAHAENGVGKFLKDRGKLQRREETKKVMIAVGRAFLFASHQRAAICNPLLRFYEELCVFNERAIFDCGQTAEAAERCQHYRGSLLWMKQESDELEPTNRRQMERFREVQTTVRLNKERLDRLKEDTLQKVELLSASRSHLLSHLLGRYLELLTTYYQKTSTIYATLAKNLSVYDHYDFEILTELIEPEKAEEQQQQPDLLRFDEHDETSLRYLFGRDSPSEERLIPQNGIRFGDGEDRAESPLIGDQDEVGEEAFERLTIDRENTAPSLASLPTLFGDSCVPKLTPPPVLDRGKSDDKSKGFSKNTLDLLSLNDDLFNELSGTTSSNYGLLGVQGAFPNPFQGNVEHSNEWESLLSQCDSQNVNDLI